MTEGNADQDGDNRISEDEFVRPGVYRKRWDLSFMELLLMRHRLLERPEASVALMRLGVDTYAAMEYGQPLAFLQSGC